MKKSYRIILMCILVLCMGCACSACLSSPNEATETYIISFDADGGIAIPAISVKAGESIDLPKTQRTGFSLDYWAYGGIKVASPFTPTKSVMLKAIWKTVTPDDPDVPSITEYCIDYKIDGGVLPSGAIKKYVMSAETIDLPIPNKPYMQFDGWYESDEFSGDAWYSIPAETARNLTLHAKWYSSNLTFVLNEQETAYSAGAYYLNRDYGEKLVFPESYNGKPVEQIGLNKFSYTSSSTACFYPTIKELFIPSSVKRINDESVAGYYTIGAFAKCTLLERVVFQKGTNLESIGKSAFRECESLKQFDFHSSLNEVGDHAFSFSGLTEMDLTDTAILRLSLTGLSSLTSLKLPSTLNDFVPDFNDSALSEITIDEGGSKYSSFDNVLYEKLDNEKLKVKFVAPAYNGSVRFPKGVLCAENFKNKAITSVILNDDLSEIVPEAFKDCFALQSVTASGYFKVGRDAFIGTPFMANADNDSKDGAIYLGNTLLKYNGAETTFTVPDFVKSIAAEAFKGKVLLTDIVLPENLEIIGDHAFDSTALTRGYLPSSVRYVGDSVFYDCITMEHIITRLSQADSANWSEFWNVRTSSMFAPTYHTVEWNSGLPLFVKFDVMGGEEIPTQRFLDINQHAVRPPAPYRNSYLFVDWYTDAQFTTLYDFNNIVNRNITLYAKWETGFELDSEGTIIGIKNAYKAIAKTTEMTTPKDRRCIFSDNWITSIILQHGARISNCARLTEITLCFIHNSYGQPGVMSLGVENAPLFKTLRIGKGGGFDRSPAAQEYACTEDSGYSVKDGVLFDLSGTELIAYPSEKSDKSYTVPGCVTAISEWAFSETRFLEQLILTGSIDINYKSFQMNRSIKSLSAPFLGSWHYAMESLEEVTITGNTMTKLCAGIFSNTYQRIKVNLPDSLLEIESGANCPLTQIPPNVKKIGSNAFVGSNMNTVIIPESVEMIDENAFFKCNIITIYVKGRGESDVNWPEGWNMIEGAGKADVVWNA